MEAVQKRLTLLLRHLDGEGFKLLHKSRVIVVDCAWWG